MMERWGLKGLESFQQVSVAKKEKLGEQLPLRAEADVQPPKSDAASVI